MVQYNAQQYSQSSAWTATAGNIQKGTGKAAQFDSSGNMYAFNKGFTVGWGATGMITEPILAYRAAKYEKRKLYMQADLKRLQQKAESTAADDVMRGGERQAASIGYQAGQAKGSSRATMAAAGVQVGASGNSAEALASIDVVKEAQVNQVLANAVAQSWGYRKAAVQSANEAASFEAAAKDVSPLLAAFVELNNQIASAMDESGQDIGSKESKESKDSKSSKKSGGGFSFGDVSDFMSLFGGGKGASSSGRGVQLASVSSLSSVGAGAY